MSELFRLVYSSRNRIKGSSEEIAAGVRSILAAAKRKNPPAHITGVLMFNRGCFVQVLEGPQTALSETFERIQQDERHGDVSILAFEPAEGRRFENWSMGFVGTFVEDIEKFDPVAGESGFDPRTMSADRLSDRLLHILIEQESPAAEAQDCSRMHT